MKSKLIVLFSVTLLLVGLYWVGTHGYIEVRLQASTGADAKVQILSQTDGKASELTAKNGVVKKLVRRGQYEILVRQGGSSFFAVSKSKSWLGSASVDAVLVTERDRQFIGDNPGPCGAFNNRVLITYGCGDTFHNALIHMPATPTQPTYALKPSKTDGTIEGIINTAEGTIVVLKRLPSIDRDTAGAHSAYLLNEKSEVTGGVTLKGLDEKRTYTVSAYNQGFVLSTDTFGRLFYFSSRDAAAVELDTALPKNMAPYAFSASKDSIVVAHAEENKDVDLDDPKTASTIKSGATVISGQQTKTVSLDKRYASLTACGPDRLCTLLNKRMEVYDISKDKPKLLFAVLEVDQMNLVKDRLVVVRGKEVLTLDTGKRTGSIDYSLGDYDGCGLLDAAPGGSSGYTVCVINSRGKKAALLIDPSRPNQDDIDKKIAKVLKTSEIKSMSIYGSYITVTPEAGKTVYDPAAKEFRYSPEKIKAANAAINQALDRAGIDRAKYQVRNTLD